MNSEGFGSLLVSGGASSGTWPVFRYLFAASWAVLGASRAVLGASWERLGPSWGSFGDHFWGLFRGPFSEPFRKPFPIHFGSILGAKLDAKNRQKPWRVVQNQGFQLFATNRVSGPVSDAF